MASVVPKIHFWTIHIYKVFLWHAYLTFLIFDPQKMPLEAWCKSIFSFNWKYFRIVEPMLWVKPPQGGVRCLGHVRAVHYMWQEKGYIIDPPPFEHFSISENPLICNLIFRLHICALWYDAKEVLDIKHFFIAYASKVLRMPNSVKKSGVVGVNFFQSSWQE